MKKLSQILKPIAAPEYAEQRNHIHSQYVVAPSLIS